MHIYGAPCKARNVNVVCKGWLKKNVCFSNNCNSDNGIVICKKTARRQKRDAQRSTAAWLLNWSLCTNFRRSGEVADLHSPDYYPFQKTRVFAPLCIWTYVWQHWKPSLSICCTMFQHWINAKSFPVSQLCVNTLLATKVTLITNGI
jgi:hypothetical protein